mmetsp:Transcript_61922/g.133166  ORF Transcript_61922/g.133166 Transcript_61922/m.133166 type:complete len:231 (+) Transcript_61922:96-788(+)
MIPASITDAEDLLSPSAQPRPLTKRWRCASSTWRVCQGMSTTPASPGAGVALLPRHPPAKECRQLALAVLLNVEDQELGPLLGEDLLHAVVMPSHPVPELSIIVAGSSGQARQLRGGQPLAHVVMRIHGSDPVPDRPHVQDVVCVGVPTHELLQEAHLREKALGAAISPVEPVHLGHSIDCGRQVRQRRLVLRSSALHKARDEALVGTDAMEAQLLVCAQVLARAQSPVH